MKLSLVKDKERIRKYPELFGLSVCKGVPLYILAENIFYTLMDKMVTDNKSSFYDFFNLEYESKDLEYLDEEDSVEVNGFLPISSMNGHVELKNSFGTEAFVTCKTASIIVWVSALEQIASIPEIHDFIRENLYRTISVIKSSYHDFVAPEDIDKVYSFFD